MEFHEEEQEGVGTQSVILQQSPTAWHVWDQWWGTLTSSFPVMGSSSHTYHEQKAHQLQNKDLDKRNQYNHFMEDGNFEFLLPDW